MHTQLIGDDGVNKVAKKIIKSKKKKEKKYFIVVPTVMEKKQLEESNSQRSTDITNPLGKSNRSEEDWNVRGLL